MRTFAVDNYLKESYKEEALDRLESRPLFDEYPITITITNSKGDAVGDDDETSYFDDPSDITKPYLQRGEEITVRIDASYPLSITLWGN